MNKILINIGFLFVLMGIIFIITGYFKIPLGKLPGDIYIKKENFIFIFPITSAIIISIFLSLIVGIIKRFF